MITLDTCHNGKLISGKWGNAYTFTSQVENNVLYMTLTNLSGEVIAKWEDDWIVKPLTPKEYKAASDILEFLNYRNSVSYWMKSIS
ncbi:hypothetical protein [Pseudoneobacillus sp. C159]